jgi:RHS repeat-associated protein
MLELTAGGSTSEAWALFDRDTTTGWEPMADSDAAQVELTAQLDENVYIEALKVFGPSAYRLSLFDEQRRLLEGPHELGALPDGWTTFSFTAPRRTSKVTLRIEPAGDVAGGRAGSLSELELWATGAALPLAWEPGMTSEPERPSTALADVLPAAPGYQGLSHDPGTGLTPCASFTFDLPRHPGVYRRAWLRYRTEGVFRPLVLTRLVNGGPMTRGFWIPPMPEEAGSFVHSIDPELLRQGRNRVEFCLPGEAQGNVQISAVEMVAELDHGSNVIETASLAPYDGVPTTSAMALLRGSGEPVAIAGGEELVLGFERWMALDLVHIATDSAVSWSLRCVGADGQATELAATAMNEAANAPVYAIDEAGQARCAGLRLRPSSPTTIAAVRVFGSGTDRRIDFPRIVLASAREHFGHEAWVDGWARPPSHVGGSVRVYVDEQEIEGTEGVFATMLQRTTIVDDAWPVTIVARYADGSSFTRQFVLEHDSGTMPGGETRNPVLDDGLTPEERRDRFGDVGQVAEGEVAPGEAKRIELGTRVSLDIPAGAMRGRQRVSLKHLDAAAVPPLDPGLINVTAPFKHAYEFQPHGELFDDALVVTLPYQPSLVPKGYVADDIQTFFYNETEKRWEPLTRAQVKHDREVVESLTDHFTVMINAIVTAPEHPQAASFDPNRLKGIKAANPTAGIQLVAPPEPNSRGDANVSYPLELPPGRLGVQPSFALSYSSARGNGWVGLGWDIGTSTIEAETRWGVPRYHETLETETYLLDGAQLSPTAHREQPRPRAQGTTQIGGETVKIFRPRIEGSFQRIVRHGNSPQNYWWEVTDTKGVRYFYGGTPESGMEDSSCLSDNDPNSGHIYRWALREVRDTHGNRVRYDYTEKTYTPQGGVPGRDLYLASAHYTLRVGESTAPYRVVFLREPGCTSEGLSNCRPDILVSGRGGFKQATSDRLGRIEVYYRQTLVRAWQLEYDQDPFGKSRLRALRQFGVNGKPFLGNVHAFDYFDEVTETAQHYRGFAGAESWAAGTEKPDTGLFLPGEFFDGVGEDDASALGGSRSMSFGGHLYTGIAFGPEKRFSVGAKFGTRFDDTQGRVALVDINGDGLADRVLRTANGGFYFNRNESGPSGPRRFASVAAPLNGLTALSHEQSTMLLSAGAEAYVFPVQFHANKAWSTAHQDTYLADVNADGFVDLVEGGRVRFNWLGTGGSTRFVPNDSSGTPVPLGASAVARTVLPATFEDPEIQRDIDDHSPPVDTVRQWQAPYAGRIRISGEVQLIRAQRAGADGLRTTIEHEGTQLWAHDFGPAETQPQRPRVEIDVEPGDRLYFRLHALADGWDDRVRWSPVIEYLDLDPAQDENGLNVHRFDAASEFALAGRTGSGMHAPLAGTLHIAGRITKQRETSDDVEVTVMVGGAPAFSQILPAASQTSVTLDQNVNVQAGDFVSLRIHTDSPIDLTALTFEPWEDDNGETRHGPWLRYVDARDPDGKRIAVEDHNGKPIFEIPLSYDMTTYSVRMPEMPAQPFTPGASQNLSVTAVVDASRSDAKGTVTFTAKSRGRLLGKDQVTIENGGIHQMTLGITVGANDPVFFSFSVSDPDLFETIDTSVFSGPGVFPTMRYGVAHPSRLSQGYRGWSYGGYSGAGNRGAQPIQPGDLDKAPIFDGSETFNADTAPDMARRFFEEELQAFAFMPMPDNLPCRYTDGAPFECSPVEGGHWQGNHELVYVTANEMSTTRLSGPVVRPPTPEQIAGAAAVPRISRSQNTAAGAGAVPFSISDAEGESHSLLDFLDMNGDGFPDVVAPARIQYTSPLGTLAEYYDLLPRDLRITTNDNTTIGVGGDIASTIASARSLEGTGAGKRPDGSASTQQMQPVGFALNIGASEGSASSEADLIDVNGDGLPDRVWKGNGTLDVALNLGYRFADREPWGQASIHQGATQEENGGATLSFNTGDYGFGGGVNASRSYSTVDSSGGGCGGTLIDVNGDGLIDCVDRGSNGLQVSFNLGHRISSRTIVWGGALGEINENTSTTLGGGVWFTISFGIGVINLIINPGLDGSESVSRPTIVMSDVDGDGYPDHLASNDPHQIQVARNLTGRTGLLQHVKRPLGAEFWLDYERTGNTQDNPQSRWSLSEVKVYDGQDDSAELGQATDYAVQRVRYADGRYDRYEREFYGFARVDVDMLDTRGWDGVSPASELSVYRRQEMTYRNSGYHERGLMIESRLLGGDGSIFQRATYQYELRDVVNGRVLSPEELQRAENAFPALVREDHYQHEGTPEQSIHTFTVQDYDGYGNVVSLHDGGGPGSTDDYRAEIHYASESAACRQYHIVGVPNRIVVSDAAGRVLRQREAEIECGNGTGNLRQVRVSLDGNSVAQTDLTYDSDGNLTSVTAPPNHRGQRYQLVYRHDSDVQTHVVRIDDSFGYYSTAAYDLRFGASTEETDLNGNSVLTEYDDFGRAVVIRGPYESQRGLDYALRFEYRPDAVVPYATTAHMDVFRSVADPIETVTLVDGLGRVLQTKKDATVHRGDDAPAADVMVASGRTHFDPWGRVVAQWFPTEEAKSAAQNLVFTRAPDTSAPPTRTEYDLLDRALVIELPDATRTLNSYTLQPALSGGGLWRMTTTIDAEDNRRDAYADARENIRAVVEYLDGRGITTRYEYDPLKQIRRVVDAKGNLTRSEYDLAGRRTDVAHPDSGHTEMVYDAAGNVVRRITANLRREGGAIEYGYDFTHLIEIRYPRFSKNNVTYTWGAASLRGQGGNQVGRIARVNDASGFEERRYGALGEIVHERRSIASHTMGESDNSPEIYVTQYLYDTWGRLQQMIYPDTEVLTYAYDSGGQVRAVEGVKLGTLFRYMPRLEYDRFDQRVFLQTGNGIRTHYDYDPKSRRLATLQAGEFQRLEYGYDKVGNVLNLGNDVANARPNEYGGRTEQTFYYDDLYRLTGASGTWHQPPNKRNQYTYTLQYDDIHNIVAKNQRHWIRNRGDGKDLLQHKTTYETAYEYASAKPHAATHLDERTFYYDDNGNQLGWTHDRSGQRRTIVWDEENRVQSISDNGRTTQFIYDDSGERIFKIGAQGETVYVNDKWTVRNRSVGTKHVFVGTTRIASKLSPGDAHVRPDENDLISMMLGRWWEHRSENGHEHGRNVEMNPHYQVPSDMPDDGMPDTNFVYFYHPDHISSTSYVTDVDGALYEHLQYFPSGETWVDQRSNTERAPHLFAGKELDQETELYYFGARYYDPRTSMWQSADPVQTTYLDGAGMGGIFNSMNLSTYSYAADNPLKYIDPDGREIRFIEDAPPQFREQFNDMLKYLENYGAANEIEIIRNHSKIVFVSPPMPSLKKFAAGYEDLGKSAGLLYINPLEGTQLSSGAVIPPVITLGHELWHVFRNFVDPEGQARDRQDRSIPWVQFMTSASREMVSDKEEIFGMFYEWRITDNVNMERDMSGGPVIPKREKFIEGLPRDVTCPTCSTLGVWRP